jgi:hypothetical protein
LRWKVAFSPVKQSVALIDSQNEQMSYLQELEVARRIGSGTDSRLTQLRVEWVAKPQAADGRVTMRPSATTNWRRHVLIGGLAVDNHLHFANDALICLHFANILEQALERADAYYCPTRY